MSVDFAPKGRKFVLHLLVDWSRSFNDKDGSFTCNASDEAINATERMLKRSDMIVYMTDIHSEGSSEFDVNGGPYPPHNVLVDTAESLKKRFNITTNMSPLLIERLQKVVEPMPKGLIVPRHVFFQDYNGGKSVKPSFTYKQVEDTFKVKQMDPDEFLKGKYKYVINGKHMFNGAGLQNTSHLGDFEGIPKEDFNSLSLLKRVFGLGENLEVYVTGTVTGICVYQTASNTKQIFPRAKVAVVMDGSTQICSEFLGINDTETGKFVLSKMLKQVGCVAEQSDEFFKQYPKEF